MKKIIAGVCLVLCASTALSWDGRASGKIGLVEVTSGSNYGFRIYLKEATASLCGNSHLWAYLNDTDSNYSIYVSTLLAAKAAQQTVTVYSNRKDDKQDGYCHIGHIQVN